MLEKAPGRRAVVEDEEAAGEARLGDLVKLKTLHCLDMSSTGS